MPQDPVVAQVEEVRWIRTFEGIQHIPPRRLLSLEEALEGMQYYAKGITHWGGCRGSSSSENESDQALFDREEVHCYFSFWNHKTQAAMRRKEKTDELGEGGGSRV